MIKNEEGSPLDICPIVVGEARRRLNVSASFLESEHLSFQLGVACLAGAEKLVHGLCRCISEHWEDDDFVAFKVDLRNALNCGSCLLLLNRILQISNSPANA